MLVFSFIFPALFVAVAYPFPAVKLILIEKKDVGDKDRQLLKRRSRPERRQLKGEQKLFQSNTMVEMCADVVGVEGS